MFYPLYRKLFEKPLKAPDENLWGLTADEIQSLRRMRTSDGWRVYAKLLDIRINMMGETLMSADVNGILDVRGEIRGLRNAPLLVDHVLKQKAIDDERARERDRAAESRPGAHSFGPFWTKRARERAESS